MSQKDRRNQAATMVIASQRRKVFLRHSVDKKTRNLKHHLEYTAAMAGQIESDIRFTA